jgi:hypothetical protein
VPRELTALKWGGRAWVLAVTTTTPKPMRRAVLRIDGDGDHPKAFDYEEDKGARGRISTRNMQDGFACLDPIAAGGVVI